MRIGFDIPEDVYFSLRENYVVGYHIHLGIKYPNRWGYTGPGISATAEGHNVAVIVREALDRLEQAVEEKRDSTPRGRVQFLTAMPASTEEPDIQPLQLPLL